MISDELLHMDVPARTYFSFFPGTGWNLEDLQRMVDDRGEQQERVNSLLPAWQCWWWYGYIRLYYVMVWFGLVWFYGIPTIVGYLMPNPFLYIKQFYFKQFSLA